VISEFSNLILFISAKPTPRLAEVDGLKRLQAKTAAELVALLTAVLDRAFKGEL